MIDADHLEPARGLRLGGIAGGVDGGGERHGLAEFPAVYLAALEIFDQIGDEAFHSVSLPDFPCTAGALDSRDNANRLHVRGKHFKPTRATAPDRRLGCPDP